MTFWHLIDIQRQETGKHTAGNVKVGKPPILLAMIVCMVSLAMGVNNFAAAYTPEDPVVQKMVSKGIKYLEGFDTKNIGKHGELALMAYAHFKVEHDPSNPVVLRGLKAAEHLYEEAAAGKKLHEGNYEVPLAILLFAAVDVEKYRSKLTVLQRYLFSNQKQHGGFSYPQEPHGDISQTQYAILAIWTLDKAGIRMDYQRVAATVTYILRNQDASGGFPYMGDTGPGTPRKSKSNRVSHSLSLAGGSSVLIGGDAMGLWGDTSNDDDPGIVGLPKAIKIYKEDKNTERRKRASFSKEPVIRSISALEGFRKKTPYKRSSQPFDFYYYRMYTLERYESFVEIAGNKEKDASPAWYNTGVDQLRKLQSDGGGWTDRSRTPAHVNTAFAVLFLIRSTQKAIDVSVSAGTRGGRGFGNDISESKLINGKATQKVVGQSVTELLGLLEKDDADSLAEKSLPENLELADNPKARAAQLDRLERLVRGSRSWQARRVAARVLGKSDELRVVPALIFALSDPDTSVKRYARDGLRFISRKFDGYDMPDKPNEVQATEAQKRWRKWYLTMNPDYVFIDQ